MTKLASQHLPQTAPASLRQERRQRIVRPIKVKRRWRERDRR